MENSDDDQSEVFESDHQHSYLKTTDIVRGVSFFEPNKFYMIPSIYRVHSVVFPGESFPIFMLKESYKELSKNDDGIFFGLIFRNDSEESQFLYGVTCQIFEIGFQNNLVKIVSKAQQRFVIGKTRTEYTISNHILYINALILPEILLPDPFHLSISNNFIKHLKNGSKEQKLKKFLAASTAWPCFVYENYSIQTVNDKIERYLAMLNIEAPEDPVLKSFWLARNLPLNSNEKLEILKNNCVNKRLILIGESLSNKCELICDLCRNKIAIYDDIFAMSRNTVSSNFINPSGFVHETLTIKKLFESAVKIVDEPSTEYSWFPGYAWQLVCCKICNQHIGWKFSAVSNRNLKPQTFFGLRLKNLIVQSKNESGSNNEERVTNDTD